METCGALFWCVREGVSREQLAGSRLDKMICPQQRQMEALDRGLKEEKQRMYMHVCFLFVDWAP